MKKIILYLSVFALSNTFAQTYSEITGQPFSPGINPSMDFFDKDSDGDLDVFISGYNHGITGTEAKLYENDGDGNFTAVTGPFVGSHQGGVGIGDIDGDNDLDIVVIGKGDAVETNVYLNDGLGNYTKKTNTGLQSIWGVMELADVDGDSDLDLIISGSITINYPPTLQTHFYLNDGAGNFTANTNLTLSTYINGIKVYDFDNDGDNDLLISSNQNGGTVKFYENNNNTGFNAPGTVLNNTSGILELIDLNNDNYMDIIIGGVFPEVYINNGSAGFTLKTGNSFGQFSHQKFCVNDFNGDGNQDILEIGWATNPTSTVARLFYNDGTGAFTENTTAGFTGMRNGGAIAADINGNGDLEILTSGSPTTGASAIKLFQLTSNVCTVNIPDANFKAYLVGNTAINTNYNTEIECTEAAAATNINCPNLSISDLTGLEAFPNITYLNCRENTIDTLDVSQNLALTYLFCRGNNMDKLILGQNSNIESLWCYQNNLTEIDLTGLTGLKNVRVDQNELDEVDFTQNVLLENVYAGMNNIDTLDFSYNIALEELRVGSNNIRHLDLSNNSSLTYLTCTNYGNLQSLNLKNGNNTNMTYLSLHDFYYLKCIEVDDPAYSNANWSNFNIPTGAVYSLDCSATATNINEEAKENSLTTYPNPTTGLVTFSTLETIKTIEIYNISGQKVAQFNNQNTIDIGNLPNGIYTAKVTINDQPLRIERLIKN